MAARHQCMVCRGVQADAARLAVIIGMHGLLLKPRRYGTNLELTRMHFLGQPRSRGGKALLC